MGSFSLVHWVIVLVIVVLVFGTKKLKNIGSDLGGAIKNFKEGVKGPTPEETAADPAAPAQQVSARKANDPNTVDVDAKTKS